MRLLWPMLLATTVGSYAPAETQSTLDSDFEFHICQAFNDEGMIVAMQMARDEALARIKTWEICVRNKLDCWQIQCYEQF